MFLNRYRDRPDTLKVENEITINGRHGKVHSLNDCNITVWDDGEVTAQRKYQSSSDPRATLPNMEIADGTMTIHLTDLVELILQRISPKELVEGVMGDPEVRELLVYALGERYSSTAIEDADRRKFLTAVQTAVHSKALDMLQEKMVSIETMLRSKTDYYRWKSVENGMYKNLHEYTTKLLERFNPGGDMDAEVKHFYQCHISPEKLKGVLESPDQRDPMVKESVGAQWHESRDYWRKKLAEDFPAPPKFLEPEIKDEIPF